MENSDILKSYLNSNDIFVKEQRKENIRSKLELDPLSSFRERSFTSFQKNRNESEEGEGGNQDGDENEKLMQDSKSRRSESCNASAHFLYQYEKNKLNKSFVFGEGKQKLVVDLLKKEETYGQYQQKQVLGNDHSDKGKIQNQNTQNIHAPNANRNFLDQQQQKYDFAKLNEKRMTKKFQLQMPEYIGNLPTEIDKISKEIQDNQEKVSLVCPENQIEFYDDIRQTKMGSKYIAKNQKDQLEELKILAVYKDQIEEFSIAPQKTKGLNPMKNYREIAPIARQLTQNFENPYKEKRNFVDLINEQEYNLDMNNLEWEDIVNVISGRIQPDQLKQNIKQCEAKEKGQKQEDNHSKRNGLDKLAKNEIVQNKYQPKELEKRKIQAEYKAQNISRSSLGIQTEDNLLFDYQQEQDLKEKKIKQQIMTQMFGKTENLLREIVSIKKRKEEFKDILQLEEASDLKHQINLKQETLLTQLLSIILSDSTEALEPYQVSKSLKQLLSNIDSISGEKTKEGHLKTHLLFQFLQLYKEFQQEKEVEHLKKQKVISANPKKIETAKKNNNNNNQNNYSDKSTISNISPLRQNNNIDNIVTSSQTTHRKQQGSYSVTPRSARVQQKQPSERFVGLNKTPQKNNQLNVSYNNKTSQQLLNKTMTRNLSTNIKQSPISKKQTAQEKLKLKNQLLNQTIQGQVNSQNKQNIMKSNNDQQNSTAIKQKSYIVNNQSSLNLKNIPQHSFSQRTLNRGQKNTNSDIFLQNDSQQLQNHSQSYNHISPFSYGK